MLEFYFFEVLKKLPEKVKKDAYFENLKSIVLNDVFSDRVNLLASIGVCKEIYEKLDSVECVYPLNDETLVYFIYELDGVIIEFGVIKEKNGYSVQLTKMNKQRRTKTILIKHRTYSLIETIDSEVIDGYFSNYDMNIYCYNSNYTDIIDVDIELLKDKLFAHEFCIPEAMARNVRNHFDDFKIQISNIRTAINMLRSDSKLSEKDYFLFREPFYLGNMKEYMKEEYAKYRLEEGKKIYDLEMIDSLPCIDRLDIVLDDLIKQIGDASEVIISNSLFHNLTLVLSGFMADALNTRGIIIKKCEVGFILYLVYIEYNKVVLDGKAISQEEAQEIFEQNPLNIEVEGLSNFFDIRNR